MPAHIVDGEFQSDKYPSCPRGLVPLKPTDPMAQDLLWEYADRRAAVDPEFGLDLKTVLGKAGYIPGPQPSSPADREAMRAHPLRYAWRSLADGRAAVHGVHMTWLTDVADQLRSLVGLAYGAPPLHGRPIPPTVMHGIDFIGEQAKSMRSMIETTARIVSDEFTSAAEGRDDDG